MQKIASHASQYRKNCKKLISVKTFYGKGKSKRKNLNPIILFDYIN